MALTTVQSELVSGVGIKNRIINGDMRIDQRAAGAAATPVGSGDVVSVDRWGAKGLIQSSKFTMQRITGGAPTGFSHYLACVPASNTTVASGDAFYIQQSIEGYNIQDLNWGTANAIPITLSFWVKSNVTGTYGGFLYGSSHSVPYSYTINASATWEYKTVTIVTPPVGSTWNLDNTYGITVGWCFGSGATYQATPGTWVSGYNGRSPTGQANIMASTSNYFYITGVQVEKGTAATPFDYRHYGNEFALCQRYYQKSFAPDVKPANNTDSGRSILAIGGRMQVADVTGMRTGQISFSNPMRAAPTMTLYNSQAASGTAQFYTEAGSTQNSTTFGPVVTSESSFCGWQYTGVTAGTQGTLCQVLFHYTAESEI